jgi:hypothetical protein
MTLEQNRQRPSTKSRWRRGILPADEAAAVSTRLAALRFARTVPLTVSVVAALALPAVDWQASAQCPAPGQAPHWPAEVLLQKGNLSMAPMVN